MFTASLLSIFSKQTFVNFSVTAELNSFVVVESQTQTSFWVSNVSVFRYKTLIMQQLLNIEHILRSTIRIIVLILR